MTVLVTGGAGYIGAHMLLALAEAGEEAVALDDLSNGARWLAPRSADLVIGDVGDADFVERVLRARGVDEVIHFAGSTLIQDSISRPLDYYENNTANTIRLLKACAACGVKRFIFSSTAAVYGRPASSPVSESAAVASISPYGASMAMSERVLDDVARAAGMTYATLRYFNVAGADPALRAGQIGKPTHLVRVAAQIAVGARRENLQIYGGDYSTPDGTAIRDYVHVSDLADAHLAALERLRAGGRSTTLNCGYGRGYSVLEVIDAVERVSGEALPTAPAPRREGDPPQLIADTAAIRTQIDWRPRYDEIDFIVRTAIDWERKMNAALLERSA
ncbi:MAG: UDP-glucose 4-epimerase GalE [Parvularculaceae bacterium]